MLTEHAEASDKSETCPQAVFKAIDTNNNGQLSADEYAHFLKLTCDLGMTAAQRADGGSCATLLAKAPPTKSWDSNNDGKVDDEELEAMIRKAISRDNLMRTMVAAVGLLLVKLPSLGRGWWRQWICHQSVDTLLRTRKAGKAWGNAFRACSPNFCPWVLAKSFW